METVSIPQHLHPLPVTATHDKRLGFGAVIDAHGEPLLCFAVQ